jgi:hypothetical protein
MHKWIPIPITQGLKKQMFYCERCKCVVIQPLTDGDKPVIYPKRCKKADAV